MSRNARKFRSLVLAVVGILAINWAIAYSSGAPTTLNPPRPKTSGAPTTLNPPRP
jgi:hypothetical protein